MRSFSIPIVALVLGASLSISAPAAAAPNDFGNSCQATTGPGGSTGIMTAKGAANPLPITAPATGVITQATVSLPVVGAPIPTVLRLARGTGNPNEYVVVAESATFNANTGTHTYPVRVPVTAGDLLGMGGSAALMCATADAGDVVALISGSPAIGSPATYTPTASRALSMVANVEPDADKDGFGDLTQDQCPQSAAHQSACPAVKVDTFATPSGKKVHVLVATDNAAPVVVAGTAKVNGKKVTLKGGTKTVTPGTLTVFKVRLPKALKSALAALPPTKTIKVTVTATATDLAGRVTSDTTKVKVPGTKE